MPTLPAPSSALRRPGVIVFLVAILLRLFVLSRYTDTPYSALQMGDMKFYHEWALRILAGQWTDGHAFYGLPGYAYLLAGFYKSLGPNMPVNWVIIAGLQSICEAITCVLVFSIAKAICESERIPQAGSRAVTAAAGLAALGYALFVPAQAFSIILMPTAWLVCAYWFCVWRAMKGNSSPRGWLGLGLLVGVVAMMIATILFAIPLFLAVIVVGTWQLWGKERGREVVLGAVAGVVLLLTGVGIGTAPAWLHNYYVAHDPVLLSAHSGLNFWMGNNPVANGYPKIPSGLRPGQDGLLKDSITRAEEAAGHPLKRTEVSRYWSAQAKDYIHEHPWEWARLLGTKIRNFWNGFQYDDISVVTLLRERGVTLPGPRFGLVAGLGLAGLLLSVRRNVAARWVAAAVLLHMAALLSVFITERYRLAAAPGLIILGVYALWRLWAVLVEKKWAGAGGVAALLLATSLLTSWPTRDPALWSLDPYNLGVKELEVAEGLLARGGSAAEKAQNQTAAMAELHFAQAHLEKAYSYLQGNAGILFACGNLALDRGDRVGARQWYERTLAIDAGYAGALKNLGFLALKDGDWPAADRFLEAARRAEPDNATTYYLLAKVKIALAQPDSARAMLKEALRMKPKQPEFLELATQFGSL